MFCSLFAKECRQTVRSLIYWLTVIVLTLFFFSHLGELEITGKPAKGQEEYGMKYSDDKQVIMKNTLGSLAEEYYRGTYSTYPIGFHKSVKPSKEENKRIGEIVKETTGITDMTVIEDLMAEHYNTGDVIMTGLSVPPVKGLSYERFQKLMQEVDDMLGGGSSYGAEMLKSNAMEPMTYEDAMEEYNTLVEKDHLTGGYARLFCDYMGIMLSILPVFLAVTRGLRDRRAQMQELIAVRKASSAVIIASRYAAMLVMLMVPVLILSCFPLAECMSYAAEAGISIDHFAFVKYSFGWLLPSVMTAAAVGLVLTVLTDTALGVLVQGVWWFLSIFSSMSGMDGGKYGWSFVPRHNTAGNYVGFHDNFAQLAANRALYAAVSVVLVLAAIWIYAKKRRGMIDIHGKISANRKNKSKA